MHLLVVALAATLFFPFCMTRSPAETPRYTEPPVHSSVRKQADPKDNTTAHRDEAIHDLILAESDMRLTYLMDTLTHLEQGGEIPLSLRNELLNTLKRLDITKEDSSREYPLPPTYVHNEPINAGAEVRAIKLLTALRGGYEIHPVIRKRLIDALLRM